MVRNKPPRTFDPRSANSHAGDIRDWPRVPNPIGGPIEHPLHGGMAPHAGSGGGFGRLRKKNWAEKNFARPKSV